MLLLLTHGMSLHGSLNNPKGINDRYKGVVWGVGEEGDKSFSRNWL